MEKDLGRNWINWKEKVKDVYITYYVIVIVIIDRVKNYYKD